ncbi:hypothetical protein RQM65_07460 [Pricia sp. S334]|uniref:T9SS C-terminal target domain-containing protein n=1 Tax=Pricia mediterranea TaxID=3076079 RepID=A0ABU3L4D8_9FLAO|nr:hypothetical protein [Pricia sp. S334]MDT7828495.1 hypothetical protein [Pricia sp. S334]
MDFKFKMMGKIVFAMMALVAISFTACSDDDNGPVIPEATCSDGQRNGSETGIDCGGPDCEPCTDADPDSDPNPEPSGAITVSDNITTDTDWTADTIYTLEGRIFVESGATLTIAPGTIIKGASGSGANASVLIVSKGAMINAAGTAEEPIILTSVEDNIEIGQTAGTNLDQNDTGKWGGLIILGNAPVSLDGDAESALIEGLPTDTDNEDLGSYGGKDPTDNSGTLQYVSIRHGGIALSEGNEINGLTMGGVGNGTTVDHIEVVGNKDDGIEFFGGTVDASSLFVWAQEDDAIDIDQAYSGTIDNVYVVLGGTSDHAFEIDGPEGSLAGSFTLTNATLVGNADNAEGGELADYRSGATGITSNIYVIGFPEGKDVELDNNQVAQNWLAGLDNPDADNALIFEAWEVVGFGNEIFIESVGCIENCNDDDNENDVKEKPILSDPTFTEAAADWTATVEAGAQTVGATASEFSWTYSNTKAGLGL